MLKQRLIAKTLISPGGITVKYRMFTEQMRVVGDPETVVRTLDDANVDEHYLCFLGAVDVELVRRITQRVFTPVTVAGSICDIATVDELITGCGVEKIVTRHETTGERAAGVYGRQAICWPYDYEGDGAQVPVPEWAGEVIATSIDRDGMGEGLDIGVLRFPWELPVVIAGGVGKLSHVKQAFDADASGVCVSSMWAFSSRGPVQTRAWLTTQGSNVRVV